MTLIKTQVLGFLHYEVHFSFTYTFFLISSLNLLQPVKYSVHRVVNISEIPAQSTDWLLW